jgi:hypothetical protein
LVLRFTDLGQHGYEVIGGVLLAGETIAEQSAAMGYDCATISEKARRFLEGGMLGLVDRRTMGAEPAEPRTKER